MSLPDPQPGLVIRYRYLWRREAKQGQENGVKDRPCVVVLAVERENGKIRVVVAPVTHSPPSVREHALSLPAQTKQRLRLDDQASWIVTQEVNVFTWPGPDIVPISFAERGRFDYGYLPSQLTTQLIEAVKRNAREGSLPMVQRSE